MTRPCVRCGRSIGEATRACRSCIAGIRAAHPEQWTHRWVIDTRVIDDSFAPTLPWAPVWRASEFDGEQWHEFSRSSCEYPQRDFVMLNLIADDRLNEWVHRWAVPAGTEDLAPIWRHIDGWLYELTGDRPE